MKGGLNPMGRPVYKYSIKLSGKEKQELRQAKRRGCPPARLVLRILMILLADAGKTLAQTAATLGCCEQTVLNQRKRFLERRAEGVVAGLLDLPRSGRPPVYTAPQRAQVTATVCATLKEHELPLSRFSVADLLPIVRREDGLTTLSHSSLARYLREDVLKPWQYHHWLFPRDPDFVSRACVVLDLYAGFWEGQQLGPKDHVLSADEKSSLQILRRCHPGRAAIPGYPMQVEFEYERLGTLAYHAAWDVFRGRVFGQVVETTSIATFNPLVHQVMGQEPYHSGDRVFWVVDGGCAHHRSTFPARLQGMYAQAIAVMLPVHASWLNQIELYFSIVQRKVLTPLDVADGAALTQRLLDFQDYYAQTAKPFTWKFTTADLKKRLEAVAAFDVHYPKNL
jgi:hypothetical protein